MKRIIIFFSIFLFFILMNMTRVFAENNLVKNPSFEQENGNMPTEWLSDSYDKNQGASEIKYEKALAHSGESFVTIINNSTNDTRFKQDINVKENSIYKLSCWIKTEDVGSAQNEKGANISIEGKMETSRDIKGTVNQWEAVEMYVMTGDTNTFKLTIGIGGYSASNTGKASFDDVAVEEVSNVPEGAVVAQLGASNSTEKAQTPSKVTPDIGGPGKSIWILLIVGVIVALVGFAYYVGHVKPQIKEKEYKEPEATIEEADINDYKKREIKEDDLL
jgi:dolichyl-phosphate-mannose-protein mannosyltransferase